MLTKQGKNMKELCRNFDSCIGLYLIDTHWLYIIGPTICSADQLQYHQSSSSTQ